MRVLTAEEMRRAEKLAVEAGSSYEALMEQAGQGAASLLLSRERARLEKEGLTVLLGRLAGPLSNLVLAFVSYIVALLLTYKVQSDAMFIQTVQMFFSYIGALSVGLGVFNLIPVHPLDGSRVLDAFLPYRIQAKLDRYQPIILLAVVAIVYFGLFDLVINRVDNWILNLAVRAVFPFL